MYKKISNSTLHPHEVAGMFNLFGSKHVPSVRKVLVEGPVQKVFYKNSEIVFVREGATIGRITYDYYRDSGELNFNYEVDKSHRGKGVGTVLILLVLNRINTLPKFITGFLINDNYSDTLKEHFNTPFHKQLSRLGFYYEFGSYRVEKKFGYSSVM